MEWETRPEKKPTYKNQSPLKAYRYTQRESYYCRLFVIENYLLGASILLISYGARIHFTIMLIVKSITKTRQEQQFHSWQWQWQWHWHRQRKQARYERERPRKQIT